MLDAIIVVDSSANLTESAFPSVPLKIITSEAEYIDDASLDTAAMVEDLLRYNGPSSSACPSPQDWIDGFRDKPYVFCVAITSNLSGCCNAANIAKADYEQYFPDRKVCVIDSLSTAGEMELIAEKLQELIELGLSFDEIQEKIREYQQQTGLLFMLQSMQNLANNGRVSKLAAKAAGFLGIRVVGKASDVGTLEQLEKVRGEKNTLLALLKQLEKLGYRGGKVRISHCLNEDGAQALRQLVLEQHPQADVTIRPTGGLCAFYAEKGGLLIGFEK